MNEQIKELFPVINLEGSVSPNAFFLVCDEESHVDDHDGKRTIELSICKINEPRSIAKSEEQAYADIESLFEYLTSDKSVWNSEDPHSLEQAKGKIAANTRRGVGNTVYGSYVFYHGKESADRIATVMKNDNGYFVFVNPKAQDYIERLV